MLKTDLSVKVSPQLPVTSVTGEKCGPSRSATSRLVTAMIDAFAVSAGGLSPAFAILPRSQRELENTLLSPSVPRAPAEKGLGPSSMERSRQTFDRPPVVGLLQTVADAASDCPTGGA
jgi:hypothetical protein